MKFTYFSKTEVKSPFLRDSFYIQDHRSREAMINHAAKAIVAGRRVKVCVRIDAGNDYWFAPHIVEVHP